MLHNEIALYRRTVPDDFYKICILYIEKVINKCAI